MSGVHEVFPPGGLDQSIVLAVLLGVWVTLLFTETLGWVFVGLVVPGYLASVLVVQPTTAAIIVVEALATYWLARGLAYALAPTQAWTPFFGRDRFFVIVVASVLVRQHNQLWVLPGLSIWLEGQMGISLPPVREFYSIGLVLVPLTANLMWKPGAVRGLVQLAVVTGLTYAGLTFVLLPTTNLSLSSFELLYEDTAVDFLGNAKAYILMLTTAALAARFNLKYGWDFGGILIPALLGLLWFTPRELAVTLIESCVLWAAATVLLKYTPLRRRNLEGPRKVALVFTLAVVLKWLLSLAVGQRLPGIRARDLFGFGYLLSSLLALRMLSKGSARKILLPALTTALAGWGLGSVIGFGLDVVAPVSTAPPGGPRAESLRLLRTPLGAMALARVQAELAPPDPPPVLPAQRVADAEAWAALAAWSVDPGLEEAARMAAARADLVVARTGPDALHGPAGAGADAVFVVVAAERGVATGAPVALIRPGARGPVLAVPWPVREAPAAEGAALLATVLGARAVVVSGRDGGDEAFATALANLAPGTYVELQASADVPRDRPAVHVEKELPAELDVRGLGTPRLEWSAPPAVSGAPWGSAARVVLRLHPGDMTAALALGAPPLRKVESLLPWLGERERGPAVRPWISSAPPSPAELVFLERRVARPLLALDGSQGTGEALAVAARMAGLVDHVLWDIRACGATGCLAAAEADRTLGAGWATLVTRAEGSGVVEAPHPREEPGTARLAAELWVAGQGRVLIVGGGGGAYSSLQAMHQAAMAGGGPVVQVRGLGREEDALVIGLGQAALDPRPLPSAIGAMLAPGGTLAWAPRWKLADGSAELGPLSGAGNPQIEFATGMAGQSAAVLWFPPRLRAAYEPHDPCPALVRIAALGVGAGCGLRDELAALAFGAGPKDRSEAMFDEALARVERFAESGDLHLLRGLLADGWWLDAGLGRATGRGFVALRGGPWRGLVWLGPANPGRTTVTAAKDGLWVRGRSVVLAGATVR